MSPSQADAIAATVLDQFDRLPANRKPVLRTNGVREWVPLSGIVVELPDGQLECLAMATGMKCLPTSKLPASKGVGLHDWHAEVLAMRAFNHFVLQECRAVLAAKTSPYVRATTRDRDANANAAAAGPPFAWRDDIVLHMYCSEAPCGDASMELTMAAQEDASPWGVPDTSGRGTATGSDSPAADGGAAAAAAASGGGGGGSSTLPGRAYFSQLGAVRRKPGRGDAPPSLSKSCSDKLALRQVTGLLGALAALLVAPSRGLCLRSVVVPVAQYAEAGCRRSFGLGEGGRMRAVAGRRWPGGYEGVPLVVRTTEREFRFSRRQPTNDGDPPIVGSNLATAWTPGGLDECLVGGVLRGRRAFDAAGASAVSRRGLWQLAREVAAGVRQDDDALYSALHAPTYAALKASPLLAARARVKADVQRLALPGWVRNTGDEAWGMEEGVVVSPRMDRKRKREVATDVQPRVNRDVETNADANADANADNKN